MTNAFGFLYSYTGVSMDIDSLIVLMAYKEDGITPVFYFFKDGIVDEKV